MPKSSRPGRKFSIPSSNGDNYSRNALMAQLPETLKDALGAKGKPLGILKAMKDANPFYSEAYSDFSENCQRCIVAYELRRRGYDVTAQPTYANDPWPQNLNVNGNNYGRWRGAFQHAKTDQIGVKGNKAAAEAKVLDKMRNQMLNYGEGSRAVVRIGYRGSNIGHVFSAEVNKGVVYYVDAQTGSRYSSKDMKNLMHVVDTSSVTVTRTDNLRISNRAKEFVWQEKRR